MRRLGGILVTILAVVLVLAAVAFVGWSPQPERVSDRVWVVILSLAVVGVPLGIWLGTQEKFYL